MTTPLRTLAFVALALALPFAVQAQIPPVVGYQGYLTDADGEPITSTDATLTFRLWESADPGGSAVWTETQTGLTLTEGVFSVGLGAVEDLSAVAFDRPLWLSMAVGDVGADELLPRLPLTAVPYSLRARTLDLPFAEEVEANDAPAIDVTSTGSRDAAHFRVDNVSNFNSAVLASTNGTGAALFARTFGSGRAGLFRIDNNGNTSPALEAVTTSLAGSVALLANHAGNDPDADVAVFQSDGTTQARIDKEGVGHFSEVNASALVARDDLSGAPAPGGVYRDNVVYAWAQVLGNGTVVSSYGCTVTRQSTGTYRIDFDRALPNGVAPVVTATSANDPVLPGVTATSTSATVRLRLWIGSSFILSDYGFFVQVVGRP